ncbi:MAG: hypothetical protein CALGDGBN_02375 [Pseudomonadales bacterium]|nr:hypothetical protein [Pseudomonadales bacterium]
MPAGVLALIVVLAALLLLPLLLADAMVGALLALGLSSRVALLLVIAIFLGSLFNVPVWRRSGASVIEYRPQSLFGLERLAPRLVRAGDEQIVALNIGGCIVPTLIVVYELLRLAAGGGAAVVPALAVIALNVVVCHRLARPVAGLGILLPALVPGCLAALAAQLFAGGNAPAVAFCAGVLGPLIGADVLHLRDLGRRGIGVLSIGGAGTFDGIVISGFLALLLSA